MWKSQLSGPVKWKPHAWGDADLEEMQTTENNLCMVKEIKEVQGLL